MKKFIGPLIAIGILTLLCTLFIKKYQSLRYNYFKNYKHLEDKIPNDPTGQPLVNQQQYLILGWLDDPRADFLKHPFLKPPHVIRIGVFGNSWTVCGGQDKIKDYRFPGLLESKFKEAGFNNVEVINFGLHAYGFFQQYKLWEFVGRKYNLDYLIFTINDNIELRDLTFSFSNPKYTDPLHARYILKDNHLKLISPVGNSRDEIIKTYNDLFPPLRYLLYGKEMPLWLKALLPNSLHNRINPFYYKRFTPDNEELYPIYAAMLKNIALMARHVVILVSKEDLKPLRHLVQSPNVSFYVPQATRHLTSFLYYDNVDHPNPFGNQIIADELFDYLSGKKVWNDVSLQLSSQLSSTIPSDQFQSSLSNSTALDIKAGQYPVAIIQKISKKNFNGILSFLYVSFSGINKIIFIPLPFPLNNNEPVLLTFRSNGHETDLPLGTIDAPNKIIGQIEFNKNIVVTASEAIKTTRLDSFLILTDKKIIGNVLSSSGEAFIRIGKKNILKVTLPNNGLANLLDKVFHRKSYSLKLPLQELYFRKTYPQSSDEYFFGINPFFEKKEGVLDLVSGKQSGKEEKCPLFSYRLVPFKEPIVNPYKELIKELNYETGFRLKVTKISHKAFNI